MGRAQQQKPHVVLVPFPAHGHVVPHVQLGRLLQARGAHVTLVHTALHHSRLVAAKGPEAAAATAPVGFGVEVIPNGLSLESPPRTLAAHHDALEENCLEPFKALLRALADRPGVTPVSCVVADVPMSFASTAARAVRVPDVQFFTASACGLMRYSQFDELIRRGLIPLGNDYKTDGTLDTPLEWVPGMKDMRLKDMPTFCRTTDTDDALIRIHLHQTRVVATSKAVIINTFHAMEKDVLEALAAILPPIYTVGPLSSIVASSLSPSHYRNQLLCRVLEALGKR